MGELTPGDAKLLRRLSRERNAGTPEAYALPLPASARFGDGSVHAAMKERGYFGAFRVEPDGDGPRRVVLTDFDSPSSWKDPSL